MKGCLKQCSRAPSPTNDHQPRKTVVFDAEGLEQFFIADEWDRTPSEPARHLSYQSVDAVDGKIRTETDFFFYL